MIQRPKPKTLSPEAQAAIINASSQQTGQVSKVRSYDPNYPVFEIPINQKILIYVPNHTLEYPDGSIGLRMDKFAAHAVIDGRNYNDIRCTATIVAPELGLDGSCPLCDSMNEVWELYNHEYADVAKSKGIDPKAPEAQELLKEDRKDLVKSMVIKQAEVWYTFPIVVIECEEKNGQLTTTPKKDPVTGQIKGTPMWYSIREKTYEEKWIAGFDALSDDDNSAVPNSPAGLWAVLNFTYTPKSGKHDKMGSARSLKVVFKTMEGYGDWATYFDDMTADWDIAKAQETVVLDVLRDMEEMQQVRDVLMKPVHDKLAMYQLGNGGAGLPTASGNAEQALANFGATPVEETSGAGAAPAAPPSSTGSLPQQNLTAEMPNVGVES